jgi:hypothetical protein
MFIVSAREARRLVELSAGRAVIDGITDERVYDVALSDGRTDGRQPVGNTDDLKTGDIQMTLAYPTLYKPEVVERFLELVAGGQTPMAVCRMKVMPSRSTVSKWARDFPEFARKLHEARIEMAHVLAEESLEIADKDNDPQRAPNCIGGRKILWTQS